MSNFWREVRGSRGRGPRKALLLLSLFLVPCSAFPGPYADLDARLRGRPDAEAVTGLRRVARGDEEAQAALEAGPKAARAYVGLRATLEGAAAAKPPPIGKGPGDERIASSWLGRAFSRLHAPSLDLPRTGGPPNLAVGAWATTLMWALLAGLLGFAVYLLARYVRLPGLRRRAKGLVDEEKPLRTADAWLEEANALIAQGRYREAVRGLYVAGLLRFDEAGVARFDRHQTNWEHLRRIEASPKRPEGAEIRDATVRFDRVWYGHLNATADDASAMRSWYDALVRRLAEAKPA